MAGGQDRTITDRKIAGLNWIKIQSVGIPTTTTIVFDLGDQAARKIVISRSERRAWFSRSRVWGTWLAIKTILMLGFDLILDDQLLDLQVRSRFDRVGFDLARVRTGPEYPSLFSW